MEPGRSLVGSAGITLYKVGSVKEIPGIRKYVAVDGGMCDNPRFIMYEAQYTAVVANKADKPKTNKATIAGKCCESGDLLARDVLIEDTEAGDILAVLATGAYNYSMSSNYNRIPKPPVVMVKDGECRVVVKRETYDDILRNDII
jgi:diaminopimelate decarboxylase